MEPSGIGTILVVDDSRVMREELVSFLGGKGYRILEAADGEEGWRMMDETLPDILITDLIMPGKDGIELIRHAKRVHKHMKVIAISGGGAIPAHRHLGMARRLGADYVMEKPLDWKALETTVSIYMLTYFV
ncbi:MAG: response regulator [Bacteroidales bacterium]